MSKSAREDRPWKYSDSFGLEPPASPADLQKMIVKGCTCYGCEANRRWLKQMNERKTQQE